MFKTGKLIQSVIRIFYPVLVPVYSFQKKTQALNLDLSKVSDKALSKSSNYKEYIGSDMNINYFWLHILSDGEKNCCFWRDRMGYFA